MRRAVVGMSLAVTLVALASTPMASPRIAAAAGCVRFVASNFDAAGNDHTNENGEWVRIKNVCSTGKDIGGWQIHDYGRIHVYRFPAGFRLGAGNTVTLYTGSGGNTASKRYWGRGAAVWNNDPPEYAHLRNGAGTIVSKWTEY